MKIKNEYLKQSLTRSVNEISNLDLSEKEKLEYMFMIGVKSIDSVYDKLIEAISDTDISKIKAATNEVKVIELDIENFFKEYTKSKLQVV